MLGGMEAMKEAKPVGTIFADLMEEAICKKCAQYEIGCTPLQVVECTTYFINLLSM